MSKPGYLLIRADASTEIGLGHIMRCLALAQAWQDRSGEVAFLCASLPDSLDARLKAEGCRVIRLSSGLDVCADANTLMCAAEHLHAVAIVVDGYRFGAGFYDIVEKSRCTTLCVDDFGNLSSYKADYVLNQNLDVDATLYERRSPSTRLLLGTTYALLRRELLISDRRRRISRTTSWNVLVTLGGADKRNITRTAIEAVKGLAGCQWNCRVIVGNASPHLDALRELVHDDERLEILCDVSDMSDHYQWADVAITAGGSTNWEMCYFGLPRIVLVTADNQVAVAEALHRRGAALSLGDCLSVTTPQIQAALKSLFADPSERSKRSLQSMALVDGKGASRCAQLLAGDTASVCGHAVGDAPRSAPHISLRPATLKDSHILLEWRNDPQTRAVSRTSSPIELQSHLRWLSRALVDDKRRILIAEIDGQPVGTARIDFSDIAEISWTVAPSQRGKGIGNRMVAEVVKDLRMPVSAVTKATNVASRRVAENAGFRLAIEDGEWLTYLRLPTT